MLFHTIKENKQELPLCLWLLSERNTHTKKENLGSKKAALHFLSHTVRFSDGLDLYATKELVHCKTE